LFQFKYPLILIVGLCMTT